MEGVGEGRGKVRRFFLDDLGNNTGEITVMKGFSKIRGNEG